MNDDAKHLLLLVRHNPRHAVVAHCKELRTVHSQFRGRTIRLLRVTPDMGPLPEIQELTERDFPSRQALRQALIEKMKETANVQ